MREVSRIAAGLALALAVILGGCGGGDSGDTNTAEEESVTTAAESPPPEEVEPGSTVSTGIPAGGVGRVVLDGTGFTLYHFDGDKRNSGKTACYGRCTLTWLPYLTPQSDVEVALKARKSLVGAIERKDGTLQVTYGGWPLYTHAREGWPVSSHAHEPSGRSEGAGDHSFGGVWYPIDVNGEVVR